VVIAQFDGSTTMHAPRQAAGLRPVPTERAGRLDAFLGLGCSKQPRGVLERVP
jgi:hypothetical protein